MKKYLNFFLLLALLASASAFANLPKTIRFATEATYPPFEFVDASGAIQGFDIDIVKSLCAHIKTECTFSNQPWDSLIPSLKLGKFDALVGAMAITDARKEQVDFTDPYYATTANFIALKKNNLVISPEGLRGKTIGVQGGTTLEHYLAGEYPTSVRIKTYASQQDAFLDLTSGRLDAVLSDTPLAIDWLRKNNKNHVYSIVGTPIVNPKYFGVGYGIAIKKGNVELRDALNKALKEIKANHTYEILLRKYFSQVTE